METAFTKLLDLNNLVTKQLKEHWAQFVARWAPFCSLLDTAL